MSWQWQKHGGVHDYLEPPFVPQIEASADLGGEQPHIPGPGLACLDDHVVFWLEVANVGRGASQ